MIQECENDEPSIKRSAYVEEYLSNEDSSSDDDNQIDADEIKKLTAVIRRSNRVARPVYDSFIDQQVSEEALLQALSSSDRKYSNVNDNDITDSDGGNDSDFAPKIKKTQQRKINEKNDKHYIPRRKTDGANNDNRIKVKIKNKNKNITNNRSKSSTPPQTTAPRLKKQFISSRNKKKFNSANHVGKKNFHQHQSNSETLSIYPSQIIPNPKIIQLQKKVNEILKDHSKPIPSFLRKIGSTFVSERSYQPPVGVLLTMLMKAAIYEIPSRTTSVLKDVESFSQGGLAFVYRNVQIGGQANDSWQEDGVNYQKEFKTEKYPIRVSEREEATGWEYITRRIDTEKNGHLRRVSLWTSINPELVAINYHVCIAEEITLQDEETSNQFLPNEKSQEFPFNTNEASPSSSKETSAIENNTNELATQESEIKDDSENISKLDDVIEIAIDDDDDCVIEEETNLGIISSDVSSCNQNSTAEKRLICRPMSQLIESNSTIPIRSEENTNCHSCKDSDLLTHQNSKHLTDKNFTEDCTSPNKVQKSCHTNVTRDNDSNMEVIDIDSDEETSSIPSKVYQINSQAQTNKAETPYKQNQGIPSQISPNMNTLTQSKSFNSLNPLAKHGAFTSKNLTLVHSTNSASNQIKKKKIITTPKRPINEQPLRQNQYQLAGVAKVLDIESTSMNTSSNLNTVINLKPDIIENVEEVCIDGSTMQQL